MGFISKVVKFLPRKLREVVVLRQVRKLLERWLPKQLTEDIMSGWKTWAGAIGSIAAGIGMIANTVATGEFSFEAISMGLGLIGVGFSQIGVGDKVDRAAPLGTELGDKVAENERKK